MDWWVVALMVVSISSFVVSAYFLGYSLGVQRTLLNQVIRDIEDLEERLGKLSQHFAEAAERIKAV